MAITIRSAQTISNGIKIQGTPTPPPPPLPNQRTYRYWKFSVTAKADPFSENNAIWQIGELVLKYGGQRVDYSTAAASMPSGAYYINYESPAQAIDNNPATKLCVQGSSGGTSGNSGLGWPLLIDFGKEITANSFSYYTANDASTRDPVSWILWGSSDGVNYDPVQWTENYSPPLARETETEEFMFQPEFANHVTVPTTTGGITGNNTFQAWVFPPNANNADTIPIGATAFGTNVNNHIGGIYTVTNTVLDTYQKITVVGSAGSVVFNVTNVGSNEPFEAYWN